MTINSLRIHCNAEFLVDFNAGTLKNKQILNRKSVVKNIKNFKICGNF